MGLGHETRLTLCLQSPSWLSGPGLSMTGGASPCLGPGTFLHQAVERGGREGLVGSCHLQALGSFCPNVLATASPHSAGATSSSSKDRLRCHLTDASASWGGPAGSDHHHCRPLSALRSGPAGPDPAADSGCRAPLGLPLAPPTGWLRQRQRPQGRPLSIDATPPSRP